jgi:MSHA biogenesis protein MshM
MDLQHFGLRHSPLGKEAAELWDDGALGLLAERFAWLLHSPGVGLITGEPGVGKTAALRQLTRGLNPHRHLVIYQAETDFGRLDIYRGLARALGVEAGYRRAQLWRDLKERILQLVDGRQLVPVWIIDEAQNLPLEFFRDLPAFLNFAFDTRDVMSVWLIGHPALAQTLERAPYAALAGRVQVRVQLKPVLERERFAQLIQHSLKSAGCTHTLLSDSGLEILRQASKGLPRHAGRILRTAMRLAVPRGLNHLPDDLLQLAIVSFRQRCMKSPGRSGSVVGPYSLIQRPPDAALHSLVRPPAGRCRGRPCQMAEHPPAQFAYPGRPLVASNRTGRAARHRQSRRCPETRLHQPEAPAGHHNSQRHRHSQATRRRLAVIGALSGLRRTRLRPATGPVSLHPGSL